MAESKCCFGCCNVRTGAVVVSITNIILCVIGMMHILSQLNLWSYSNVRNSMYNKNDYETNSPRFDGIIFILLSVVFLLFYTNLNLYKSTRIRNTQSINYWLGTVSIFFIFFGLYICYISMKYKENYMQSGILISIIIAYQIYLVKSFYNFEVEFLATSERNVVIQPTLHGPTYVALPNQTVQNPAFPAQPGPYVIQQVQQPLTQSSYPQQTYQYQAQQPSQSHIILPMSDQHTPQEYTNPPPYSPNYNMQEGSLVKQ